MNHDGPRTPRTTFDTHTHLHFPALAPLEQLLSRAREAGVKYILTAGVDLRTSQRAVEIAEAYPGVYAAVGIHPGNLAQGYQNALAENIDALKGIALSSEKVVAIGEIGLDRHILSEVLSRGDKNPEDVQSGQNPSISPKAANEQVFALQKAYFKAQFKLAVTLQKSIIIHNREAAEDLLNILSDVWDASCRDRVVLHCCEARQELLDYAIAHDVFIGIDGDVTYSRKKQDFVKRVPLDRLVLETDSPFLTPEPIKRERSINEPSNLVVIDRAVQQLRAETTEEAATQESGAFFTNQVTENALKLFQMST